MWWRSEPSRSVIRSAGARVAAELAEIPANSGISAPEPAGREPIAHNA